jgi:hypothetical protein
MPSGKAEGESNHREHRVYMFIKKLCALSLFRNPKRLSTKNNTLRKKKDMIRCIEEEKY